MQTRVKFLQCISGYKSIIKLIKTQTLLILNNNLHSILPSSSFPTLNLHPECLIPFQGHEAQGEWEPNLNGWDTISLLDMCMYTDTSHWDMSGNLTCISLEWRRKSEYLEKATQIWGEWLNSTHTVVLAENQFLFPHQHYNEMRLNVLMFFEDLILLYICGKSISCRRNSTV